MANKPENKEVQLSVGLPSTGHRRLMMFNRFRIEKEAGFRLLFFGLESQSGGLIDFYATSLSDESYADNEKSVMAYYGRVGSAKKTAPAWNKMLPGYAVDVVDIINVSARQDTGEIVLSLYSQNAAMRYIRATTAADRQLVQAEHLVLLRSSMEVQRNFIEALYGE